jgi:hypothetical protein
MATRTGISSTARLALGAALVCAAAAAAQIVDPVSPAPYYDSTLVFGSDTLSRGPYRETPVDTAGAAELKVVKRSYKYRQQVRLALFMMGFITLALTASQAWNPD